MLPRGLRVGTVTGTQGDFKVRPHAELSSLDVVSVLFFDTPALASTDPLGPADGPLSATPAAAAVTAPQPAAPTSSDNPVGTAVKHAGAEEGTARNDGEGQTQQ